MPKCPKDCHKPNPLIFRSVEIPAVMGDDKTYPPENGAYCNAIVTYQANNVMYIYTSDGIPVKLPSSVTSYNDLTDKPMINGVEIVGDVTLEELGIAGLISAESEARAAADEALQDAIDAETAAREAADREIIGQIPTVNDATLTIQKNGSQVAVFTANSATDTVANIEVPTATSALINDSGYITNTVDDLVNYYTKAQTDDAIAGEAAARAGADNDLQEQIDAIAASSDVVDIVGTKAELNNYDTSKLHDNDIIKVLTDESRGGATTYYRWDSDTSTWSYVGAEGPYYTKSESDATFVPQTRTVNNKALSSDITLTAADVGALPSSTVIPTVNDATLTIQKNGTNVATFTANSATNTTANIAVPTKTSDLVNDGSDNTSTYVEADDLATVATSGSYNDLTDKPTIDFELVEMSYGESNAWAKFIDAYRGHKIVYCRASSNSNPATGTQGRKAFMAYVNNADNPTEVEFQYVRSVSTKTASQPVDQVFVYKLTSANGGTWTVTTRDMGPKLAQGTNTTVSYANGTYTISATGETYTAGSNIDISNQNVISAIVPTKTSDLTNDGADGSSTYVEATDLATVATTGAYSDLTGAPTIPTVNDATLTIQRNGANVETFTANSSTNKTANIVVPTLTSDLTNDSGYITGTSYASANTGGVIKVGTGLTIDANGVLSSNGLTSVDWADVTNKPTNVSYWTNDAGYITSASLPTKTSDLTNDGSDGTSTYVEADDLAAVATSGSYNDLTNKPTIPTVNDATITIQRNSANVDSFTVNASQNKTINIAVPTKTSDLTNDSNFATTAQIPTKTSDLTNDGSDGTSTYAEADDLATVATSGSYADLSNKPTIGNATLTIQKNGTNVQTFTANATSNKTANITVPTKTSDLTNDSNFVTNTSYATANTGGVVKIGSGLEITDGVLSATGGGVADAVEWDNVLNKPTFSTVATSGSYNDLSDKPTIPTVNNATLTIQRNSTNVGTFTANASSNKTINITVPTTAADVSALPASTKYGASITVSLNTTDYKMTTTLKDQDGNTLGTAQTIDLPLESVVVNGSYDSTNKKIVLTLQNGSTIDIPVGDLIAGLQTEITSTNKLSSDLVDDTNHTHKFVTAAQITKLNGIAAGAEVNVQSDWNVTNTSSDAFIKNKPTIPTVNNGTLTIQKNGTAVATFTANQSGNATANITVPTIDDVVEIDKTLAAVTDWTNTGIYGPNLETGTYIVQVYTGGAYAGTWSERWSGIMSWHSGNTNSSNTEEILLHNAGHADNSQNLFLRTKRDGVTVSGTKYLTLQYAFSQANETTTTIKFYFRRIV